MSHLQNGRVNVSLLLEQSRIEFLSLLEKYEGSKAIVWDNSLKGPMVLIAPYDLLQKLGVSVVYSLSAKPFSAGDKEHVIFITRPQIELMDLISENVRTDQANEMFPKQYHIIFVPSRSDLCIKQLEHRGVFATFKNIDKFSCYLFPIDNDVVSMELSHSFKDYHLDRDPTCLYEAAQALIHIQRLYGQIGSIWGKGNAAKTVWDLTKKLTLEAGELRNTGNSNIHQLLLIDRAVDLISPLATQLTYEGLIDELFEIHNTSVKLPSDRFKRANTMPKSGDTEIIILNSSVDLFAEIRNKNFNAVGQSLSRQANIISKQFEERHKDKTVKEIQNFVSRLPTMLANKEALVTHTAIAECIKEFTDNREFLDTLKTEQEFMNCIDTDKVNPFIEELIALKAPLVKVLRLICLQCATGSGLKPKVLEFYKRELVQVYGFHTLITIHNLECGGLLHTQSATRQYTVLRKSLHLTMEDTSEIEPTDISYVHSVYAPLSVRLVENFCKPRGLKHLQDVLGLLPGPTVTDTQPNMYYGHVRRNSLSSINNPQPKLILVFFIGGCTFAEISALRFLTQHGDINHEFVIATTKLINGNSFIKSFMHSEASNA